MTQRGLERLGVGRVDLQRHVRDALDRLHGRTEDRRFVDARHARIDVEDVRARIGLGDRLAQNVTRVARLVGLFQLLLARRIDALADHQRVVERQLHAAGIGRDGRRHRRSAVARRTLNRHTGQTLRHGSNVLWRRAAAASDEDRASLDASRDVLREVRRPDVEARLSVHDPRHARVGLHNDRNRHAGSQTPDERQKLVRPETAIETTGIGLEGVKERRNAIDITAREKLAVFAQGHGGDHGQIRVLPSRQQRRLELVGVVDGLDGDEVGSRLRAETDLFREGIIGRVELEVSGWLEQPSRRTDVESDELSGRGGGLGSGNGRGDDVLERRISVILGRTGAKGVRIDDVGTRGEI